MSNLPKPPEISFRCPKSWDGMKGGDRRRFCDQCRLHVVDLSAMSRRAGEAVLARRGEQTCVTYLSRADGSMVTASRWRLLIRSTRCGSWRSHRAAGSGGADVLYGMRGYTPHDGQARSAPRGPAVADPAGLRQDDGDGRHPAETLTYHRAACGRANPGYLSECRILFLGLIDYGSGNLRSVGKALAKIGARVELLASPERLGEMDAVVLPGVGAFGDCAGQLHARGLWEPLADWLRADKPFLGVCLGYQLLFESSEETPGVAGFGRFAGAVQRFRAPGLKVPQIGWNSLHFQRPDARLWRGLADGSHVYFVHSYHPTPADPGVVAATADYGGPFAAAVEQGRTMGVQFHPEKSQAAGLTMLRNFVDAVRQTA